jgi:hypothetical protein
MIHRHPNQNAEDIGARLNVLSSFVVLISTTGVPKYRMPGTQVLCMDSTINFKLDLKVLVDYSSENPNLAIIEIILVNLYYN